MTFISSEAILGNSNTKDKKPAVILLEIFSGTVFCGIVKAAS